MFRDVGFRGLSVGYRYRDQDRLTTLQTIIFRAVSPAMHVYTIAALPWNRKPKP